jgi:hypothetical protein
MPKKAAKPKKPVIDTDTLTCHPEFACIRVSFPSSGTTQGSCFTLRIELSPNHPNG